MKIVTKICNLKETFSEIFGYTLGDAFYQNLSTSLKNYLNDEVPNGLLPNSIKFATYADDEFTYSDYIEDMLVEFYNRYSLYGAIAYTVDEAKPVEAKKFIARFLNALNITYPIYSKLIGIYTAQENHLLDSLNRDYTDDADSSGSSTNRFNDTPQDGGAFDDDNHTTNINEIETSSESGLEHKEEYNNEYMIDRLNKINDNLRNLYMEWENKVARMLWLIPER